MPWPPFVTPRSSRPRRAPARRWARRGAFAPTESFGAAAFPAQQDGINLFAATAYLKQDKSFILYYAEGAGTVRSNGYSAEIPTSRMFKRTGTWSVSGGSLKLGDLMTCQGLMVNGNDALRCTLDRTIGYSEAVGKSATFTRSTNTSPNDRQWADYK